MHNDFIKKLSDKIWNGYYETCKDVYDKKNNDNHRCYINKGYMFAEVSNNDVEGLLSIFNDNNEILFKGNCYKENYFFSDLCDNTINMLNKDQVYFNVDNETIRRVSNFFNKSIYNQISDALGCYWKIVNIRVFRVRKSGELKNGPNSYHTDGFTNAIKKILIYVTPPNVYDGTTQLKPRNTSELVTITSNNPSYLLFDAGTIVHRAYLEKNSEKNSDETKYTRKVIEITIAPTHEKIDNTNFANLNAFGGINATYPYFPLINDTDNFIRSQVSTQTIKTTKISAIIIKIRYLLSRLKSKMRYILTRMKFILSQIIINTKLYSKPFFIQCINTFTKKKYLNIGGGPRYAQKGVISLDGAYNRILNKNPFQLHKNMSFPVDSNKLEIVYSSHVFEHLDEQTVSRALEESHRVLLDNGDLIIKIPDYDKILKCWRENDSSFFTDDKWGFSGVSQTWANKGVLDNLDNRASMIFCGFWNQEYGDHFSKQITVSNSAYHGPAIVEHEFLSDLKKLNSPNKIADLLREKVIKNNTTPTFNHQQAWSQDEFIKLLEKYNFKILSINKHDIVEKFKGKINDLSNMYDISNYFYAKKVT